MSDDTWDAWDAQYVTINSRRLKPEECDHSRRSKHDSHVCFDCRANVGPGEE